MRKVMLATGAVLLAVGVAFAKAPTELSGPIEAKSGSQLKGRYTLVQRGDQVKLTVVVEGVSEGEHAVHVHEFADCSDPDAKRAGGHWNPTSEPHGRWGRGAFHLGDVGNLNVGKDGKGELTFSTDKWTLGGDGKRNVLGHSIVVHEKVDDFKTQPTGNAGGRIGCAVIPAAPAK